MAFRDLFDLTGKVAIVTGGAGTIGRVLTVALAEFGCDVAVADLRPQAAADLRGAVEGYGRRFLTVGVDVTKPDQVQAMVDQVVRTFGRVDILINHAGLNIRKPAVEITESDWDTVLDVNLKGIFLVAQAVGRQMIHQGTGGKIVNTASVSAVRGHPRLAAYAASKGGIAQLTRVLANEWAPYRINVNAIGPGYLETDQTRTYLADPQRRAEILSKIPMGRLGTPEDLVGAVVYLSSPASDYVTGHVLFVEGGRLID
ncbi:SDR family NAD(P)-dependent oxidoreductase [Caldinitratiruptor microaerophilus]|uniref:2-deoxy-D-gluconate 3-dehydrogenase n=1 Tax=Caldinitratiruptor microaerophilus TaxID=671077 RepID=A0AA35G787_9FIRM|nr:glucose 1-dehydrogenase [Caldinitratiruptor microaerophilus]BDG59841.1 2-deoxy-D-gluconate 3-dehydrogenase [Caldinitratiruptor microaerophilus]